MLIGWDSTIRKGLLVSGIFIFIVYSIWIVLLKFIESDSFVHKFFPDPFYGVAISIGISVIFYGSLIIYAICVLHFDLDP